MADENSDEPALKLLAAVAVGLVGLQLIGGRGIFARLVDSSPAPDAATGVDPVVNPANAVTEGSVYQGPDPLNLAPDEEGRGDLIAPFNPGNVVMEGPVYTGPDPLGLGGN